MRMTRIFFVCLFFVRWNRPPPQNFISETKSVPILLPLATKASSKSPPLDVVFFFDDDKNGSDVRLSSSFSLCLSLAVLLFFGCLLFGRRNPSHHSSSQSQSLTVCRPFSKPSKNVVNRFEFSAPHYYDFVSHSKNTKTRAKKDAKTAEMYFESEKPRGTTTTSRIRATPKIEEGSTSIFVLVEGRV